MVIETNIKQSEFTPVSEGIVLAVNVDNADLGSVESTYNGETTSKHKMKFVFEVPSELTESGKVKTIGKSFVVSLDPRSNLTGFLQSWLGESLTPEQVRSFDLDSLIGRPAKLLVEHIQMDGREMHKIVSVQPTDENIETSGEYVRFQDREETYPNG